MSSSDNRRFERQEMDWEARLVQLAFDEDAGQWELMGDHPVQATNLSAGGIGVAVGEGPDLGEGDPVLVIIHKGGPRLTIFGRVRHCRRTDEEQELGSIRVGQVAGIRFHGLPESLERSGRLEELGLAA